MQWLRLYDDVLDDPKVQRLPPDLFKHWINLLCLANEGQPRGTLPSCLDDLAFRLRLTTPDAYAMMIDLKERGLMDFIDERWKPHNWDTRQFKSDDVNVRVKALRERNVTRNVAQKSNETLRVTAPDTDTDTDTERSETSSPLVRSRGRYPDDFENFWALYPSVTNNSKKKAHTVWARLSKQDRADAHAALTKYLASPGWRDGYAPHTSTYLNGRLWEVEPAATRTNPGNGRQPESRRPSVPRFDDIAHRYKPGGGS
jgi:hypothetical protein